MSQRRNHPAADIMTMHTMPPPPTTSILDEDQRQTRRTASGGTSPGSTLAVLDKKALAEKNHRKSGLVSLDEAHAKHGVGSKGALSQAEREPVKPPERTPSPEAPDVEANVRKAVFVGAESEIVTRNVAPTIHKQESIKKLNQQPTNSTWTQMIEEQERAARNLKAEKKKKKKYRLRGRSSETAKAHRG
eukprot:TRINITY_DN1038_c0_g1_i1.p2 TRINITY_DN1038_c0_g1~~TRINITY_DN1038_c0_g1_i1.p2  ORF type:complete len:189 (+),score=40.52 TRINITY_DN1038_c0_g1_i1:736-1302(+)